MFSNLFNPNTAKEKEAAAAQMRIDCARVQEIVHTIMVKATSLEAMVGCRINVREVICGDPTCAPVDTFVMLIWESGETRHLQIPKPVNEVFEEDVEAALVEEKQQLRFKVGDRVECRVGRDPITGWAAGEVTMLWYREETWPPQTVVPYQIRLDAPMSQGGPDEGAKAELIFAPKDIDEIIRAELTDREDDEPPPLVEMPNDEPPPLVDMPNEA